MKDKYQFLYLILGLVLAWWVVFVIPEQDSMVPFIYVRLYACAVISIPVYAFFKVFTDPLAYDSS